MLRCENDFKPEIIFFTHNEKSFFILQLCQNPLLSLFREEIMAGIDILADEAISLKLNAGKSTSDDGNFYLNSCPVITFYKNADPQVIIVDFGTGCEGKDRKVRSGRIIITSTKFKNATAECIKTFEDFYVDGKKIEGTLSKTTTLNLEDHIIVAEVEEDIAITFSDNEGTTNRKASLIRRNELNIIGISVIT